MTMSATKATKASYPFISWRKKAYLFTSGLGVVFLIGTAIHGGFNKGIDFIGGTSVLVKFDQPIGADGEYSLAALRGVLSPMGLGDNIRTVGAAGASREEAREVSIDVRGSDWVNDQVNAFVAARAANPAGWNADGVSSTFSGSLQPGALEALLDNFRPTSSETGAISLHDATRVSAVELEEIFQSIFNENISLSVQAALMKSFQPRGGAREIDINNIGNADNLAEALAGLKVKSLAENIAALAPDSGPRPWTTVDEFLAASQMTAFRDPRVTSRLYTETAPRPTAVSVLTGRPDEIAEVFHAAFKDRFSGVASVITSHRDEDFGGLISTVEEALAFVPDADRETRSLLESHVHAGRFILASSETVGPSVGKDLQSAAIKAILVSIIGIVLYVWWRFELRYGVGAIVALLHDAVLTVLFIGFLKMEFSIPIVAAILTVIGYSINDTIVIYDRIREKLGKLRGSPDPELIDIAINETLTRTIGTSLTTLMASVAFLFFGPLVTRDFSLTLSFGILIGTYSSVFVAAPVLVEWDKFAKSRGGPKSGGPTPRAGVTDTETKSSGAQRRRKGFPSRK